jgi:hypothetical protein
MAPGVGRARRLASQLLGRLDDRTGQDRELDQVRFAIGQLHSRMVRGARFDRLRDAEFRVFSQFGEDGIIQYLLGQVPVANDVFVEFGVQDYRESNTRFLLMNDNWRGLILDGGTEHVAFVRSDPIGWRHTIDARRAFVTRENINSLLETAGVTGDIGLLSIDIDGNDYWVLDAIEVVQPRILIVEYNSTFGPDAAVSVPYDPAFDRMKAHSSGLYWGASLSALTLAAERKGLALVGSNSAGNNAFFVRREVLGSVSPVAPRDAWVDARFRESRTSDGRLSFASSRDRRLTLISDALLVDVASGAGLSVGDLPVQAP